MHEKSKTKRIFKDKLVAAFESASVCMISKQEAKDHTNDTFPWHLCLQINFVNEKKKKKFLREWRTRDQHNVLRQCQRNGKEIRSIQGFSDAVE